MSRDISGVSGDRLSVGDVAAVDITGTALTVSAWVHPDVVAADAGILGKTDAASNTQYFLRFLSTSKARFAIGDANLNTDVVDGATNVGTSAWQHLAGVKNGTGAGALLVYLNGTQDGSATSNLSIGNNAQPLLLGAMNAGYGHMNGRLAEVGIWSAALTPREIAALARGFSPLLVRPQSLAGYWQLLGNASPEPDLRNGNNASIVGTVGKGDHPRIILPRPALYLP